MTCCTTQKDIDYNLMHLLCGTLPVLLLVTGVLWLHISTMHGLAVEPPIAPGF